MLCGLATLFTTLTTAAQEPPRSAVPAAGAVGAARTAYTRGKEAYDHGEFASAARAFAEADTAIANDRVLELAVSAAVLAKDGVIGMPLLERAERRGLFRDNASIRARFLETAGRLVALCPSTVNCAAMLDGESFELGVPRWVRPGEHAVVLVADGVREQFAVNVEAGALREVRPSHVVQIVAAAPLVPVTPVRMVEPAAPVASESRRPSTAWFWGAAALTGVAFGVSVASGIDTLHQHDAFASDRSDADLAQRGQSSQVRTNVLLGVSAACAVATAAIAYFVFHSPSSNTARRSANAR